MAGEPRLEYGPHALQRMALRSVTPQEVERVIASPTGTYYAAAKARTSYFGRTDDGRDVEVVVHHGDGVIVTVIA